LVVLSRWSLIEVSLYVGTRNTTDCYVVCSAEDSGGNAETTASSTSEAGEKILGENLTEKVTVCPPGYQQCFKLTRIFSSDRRKESRPFILGINNTIIAMLLSQNP